MQSGYWEVHTSLTWNQTASVAIDLTDAVIFGSVNANINFPLWVVDFLKADRLIDSHHKYKLYHRRNSNL